MKSVRVRLKNENLEYFDTKHSNSNSNFADHQINKLTSLEQNSENSPLSLKNNTTPDLTQQSLGHSHLVHVKIAVAAVHPYNTEVSASAQSWYLFLAILCFIQCSCSLRICRTLSISISICKQAFSSPPVPTYSFAIDTCM